MIDGNEIELKAGVYTYNDVPVNDVSAFKVTPTAGENSNIYVSNQRVKSGATSKTVSVQKTLRVIAQDDQKEPAVYFFKSVRNSRSGSQYYTENRICNAGRY